LNLADSHIQRIGHHGGLIGVGLWDDAVCGRNVEQSVDAIARAVQLAGVDHVALGSDFDGAVQMHFDARGMPLVTNALLLRGFSEADIRKIMGENLKQFLQRHLPL
jgi:microsomal dipeptidase-like Zn-dependent dipeptidase